MLSTSTARCLCTDCEDLAGVNKQNVLTCICPRQADFIIKNDQFA